MFIVKKDCSLFSFLKKHTDLSGKAIKRALDQGSCRINGKIERFATTPLIKKDKVTFFPCSTTMPKEMELLYEDKELSIYNKPSGLTTTGNFLVHRLDKATSGVLLVAKNGGMQKELQSLFKQRKVKKTYISLIKGCLRKDRGIIENNLEKIGSFHGQTLWGSTLKGAKAITYWKCLKKGRNTSLIELIPYTGRTHQLRVHMSEMGHPILGDLQYGRGVRFSQEINRLCLHAYRLSFFHPSTGKKIQTTVPVPQLFRLY